MRAGRDGGWKEDRTSTRLVRGGKGARHRKASPSYRSISKRRGLSTIPQHLYPNLLYFSVDVLDVIRSFRVLHARRSSIPSSTPQLSASLSPRRYLRSRGVRPVRVVLGPRVQANVKPRDAQPRRAQPDDSTAGVLGQSCQQRAGNSRPQVPPLLRELLASVAAHHGRHGDVGAVVDPRPRRWCHENGIPSKVGKACNLLALVEIPGERLRVRQLLCKSRRVHHDELKGRRCRLLQA
eukprot:scaffold5532_cov263-Pinguiococcus_pyrenoidosus.AAC.10